MISIKRLSPELEATVVAELMKLLLQQSSELSTALYEAQKRLWGHSDQLRRKVASRYAEEIAAGIMVLAKSKAKKFDIELSADYQTSIKFAIVEFLLSVKDDEVLEQFRLAFADMKKERNFIGIMSFFLYSLFEIYYDSWLSGIDGQLQSFRKFNSKIDKERKAAFHGIYDQEHAALPVRRFILKHKAYIFVSLCILFSSELIGPVFLLSTLAMLFYASTSRTVSEIAYGLYSLLVNGAHIPESKSQLYKNIDSKGFLKGLEQLDVTVEVNGHEKKARKKANKNQVSAVVPNVTFYCPPAIQYVKNKKRPHSSTESTSSRSSNPISQQEPTVTIPKAFEAELREGEELIEMESAHGRNFYLIFRRSLIGEQLRDNPALINKFEGVAERARMIGKKTRGVAGIKPTFFMNENTIYSFKLKLSHEEPRVLIRKARRQGDDVLYVADHVEFKTHRKNFQ